MRLRPGLRVGPYEVVAPLGAGGMAEVYRARDTRLGRDIALKVVNEVLSGWSPEGHLWVTEGGRTFRPRTRLLRVDPRSGKVLEERSIGPAYPGGASGIIEVVLSSDGREMAFSYDRRLNTLYVASGLGP